MERPVVMKIGGSLFDQVPQIVRLLHHMEIPVLLVPGGGCFADIVRQCGVTDDSAHWMAVAAMEQFGWYIASFNVDATDRLCTPDHVMVLLPYTIIRALDPLPHTWEVTSDTIAAWIASMLDLDLIVLKSVDGIFVNGTLMERIDGAISCDEVDPFFIPFVLEHNISAIIINGRDPERIRLFLEGRHVKGTRVNTTF